MMTIITKILLIVHCAVGIPNRVEHDSDKLPIDLSTFGSRLFGWPDSDVGSRIATYDQSSLENPEELGSYFEGDILFAPNVRNGLVKEVYRWNDGVVPFEIIGPYGKNCYIFCDG